MNNDVLEVLQELELIVRGLNFKSDKELILDFIDNQRSIYSGSSGECASC